MQSSQWLIRLFLFGSGVTLLCYLGCWQLSRAAQKQQSINQHAQALKEKPLSNNDLLTQLPHNHDAWRFRLVSFKGTFLSQYTILLDNKTNNGRPGYHVYMPVALNNHTFILVNRGFIPLGSSRAHLPQPFTPKGEVNIEGYLDFAYRNPFISKATESTSITWPLRMQQLDNVLLGTQWSKTVYPMVVVLNQPAQGALTMPVYNMKATTGLSPERHRAYAFQWFALAVTFSVFFILYYRKTS